MAIMKRTSFNYLIIKILKYENENLSIITLYSHMATVVLTCQTGFISTFCFIKRLRELLHPHPERDVT